MTASDPQAYADIARRIWQGAAAADFHGSDPYDGLNSRLLKPLLDHSRLLRLLVIQGVKRSPLNLRPLLLVPPGMNPKGASLFLQGAARWTDCGAAQPDLFLLADRILSCVSRPDGTAHFGDRSLQPGLAGNADSLGDKAIGWGYDFPWQSKAFLQPAYFPTVVATSFAVDALEAADSPAAAGATRAAARFVADHLHRHEDDSGLCFSYSPGDRSRVFNASLFGARILAQAAVAEPDAPVDWRGLAERAVDYVVSRQRDDGAWEYGEADHWHWIDNLHTGFNLVTIDRIARYLDTERWDDAVEKGLRFYREALFEADGTPRYYTNSKFPIDPHSFAQGALTFLQLQRLQPDAVDFADRILRRGIAELWDQRRGGFIFQKQRGYTQRIVHLRWSQAWMFRALCERLAQGD
jgi:hypothetical protein